MTQFIFGDSSLGTNTMDTHKLTGQVLDAGTANNDPVYLVAGTWFKSVFDVLVVKTPVGIRESSTVVVIRGVLTTTGLTTGRFYYWDKVNGGITLIVSDVKVGFAKSITELLVDIDITEPTKGIGVAGFIAGLGPVNSGIIIDKLVFSSESTSTLTSKLLINHAEGKSASSTLSGFILGSIPNNSNLDKLLFSTDNTSAVISQAATATRGNSGFDSSITGYFSGNFPATSIIRKLLFSNENVSDVTTKMVVARSNFDGFDSSTFGYNAGQGGGSIDIEKMQFSDDVSSNVTSNMSIARTNFSTFDSTTNGYMLESVSNISTIDKLLFSNDNTSTVTAKLFVNQSNDAAGFNSSIFGYISGGGSPVTSRIENLEFSTENVAVVSSVVSVANVNVVGFDD